MPARLIIAPEAARDLDEVWFYIARNDPAEADRFLDRLLETSRVLADMPGMGRRRPDLAVRMRCFPVGTFLIFYQILDDGIEVVRVLHGARNIEDEF